MRGGRPRDRNKMPPRTPGGRWRRIDLGPELQRCHLSTGSSTPGRQDVDNHDWRGAVPDSFVHLHVHTEYSMLDGAARVDDLFREAARMEMPALAMTDHGFLFGAVDFYQAGKRHGVKSIIGLEAYLAPGHRSQKHRRGEKEPYTHLTLLAENQQGYANLLKLCSIASLEGFFYKPRMDRELLAELQQCIIGTSGCLGS